MSGPTMIKMSDTHPLLLDSHVDKLLYVAVCAARVLPNDHERFKRVPDGLTRPVSFGCRLGFVAVNVLLSPL